MKNKVIDFLFEIIYVLLLAIMIVFCCSNIINEDLQLIIFKAFVSFYNDERLNLITVFLSIISGIYLTVITIIGTSRLCVSAKLLTKKLDRRLINYFLMGLIEDILGVVLCIIIDGESCMVSYLIASLTIVLTIVSFFRFSIILRNLLIANLDAMVEKIDDDNRNNRFFIEMITRIEENTKSNK